MYTARILTAMALLVVITCIAPTTFAAEPFNGKNLDGWKFKDHGPKNNPHWKAGKASLNADDPRLFKVDTDASGELINDVTGHGQGVDIYSEAKFGDQIIELEVMVPKGSNSGIYVMGRYEVQVLDSYGKEANPGPGDMGAIYGAAPPKNPSYKKPGEWSKYEIHFQAPKYEDGKKVKNARFIKVVLNGREIHTDVEMKNVTPGGVSGEEAAEGPIMFQGDHGPVSYRNLKIRPLDAAASVAEPVASLCAEESASAEKTIKLFDGGDLSHWVNQNGGEPKWQVADGVLTIVPGTGSIMTKEKFGDFQLHLEFNIKPTVRNEQNNQANGNSGVYIQRRYEIQILDSHGHEAVINGCGAIYKQKSPDTNASKPAGEWQTYEITFHQPRWEGSTKTKNARITVVHNGVKIHDNAEITNKTGAGQAEAPSPGPILLQDHSNVVSFRNIRITKLD